MKYYRRGLLAAALGLVLGAAVGCILLLTT